jgi:diaminopimelate epimerase
MIDVDAIENHSEYFYLNTGSPHTVSFVVNLDKYDVVDQGRVIRYSPRFFEKGTNVNFVEKLDNQSLYVRTYERGVEDETYSCGTGITACSLVAGMQGMNSPIRIKTWGGDLEVSFDLVDNQTFRNIFLAGPAELVFEGMIDIG